MNSADQIIEVLQDPLFANIPWVFVTRGAKGAIVKAENKLYEATIPSVKVVNAVGSGDSVVAGIAAAIVHNEPEEEIIKNGLTMGTLNAMEEKTGHIHPDKVGYMKSQINVHQL